MKSVFYAGAGIQSVLFFLNDGYLSATLARRKLPAHRLPHITV